MAEINTSGGVGRVFHVEMGAFAPRLSEQEVAPYLTAAELDRFQLMADSLTVVIVHGLVSNIIGNRGRDKLAKTIVKALRPVANATPPLSEHSVSETPGDTK